MNKITRIITENPIIEQWRLLNRFSYPPNINKHMINIGIKNQAIEKDKVDLIAGSIRQGEAYFKAAQTSSIDIAPLLLYYGATNLFLGSSILTTNQEMNIKNHGMLISNSGVSRIADIQILPRNRNDGALQIFSDIFSPGCNLINGASWNMGEILGSIPDVVKDYKNHYDDFLIYTVPVETIRFDERTLDRISLKDLAGFESPNKALSQISKLSEAYLTPQIKEKFIILNHRREGIDIGVYSISGRKYLQIGHEKRGEILNPNLLILMYMGLYVLGFMPRYRPQLWNPFVNSDQTGEKYIIERFLSVCQRYLPHLVLNFINHQNIRFANETEGLLDLRTARG